jgi:hypothetical protein
MPPLLWALLNVVEGGNNLTLYRVSSHVHCKGSIWVMKEYGIVESWTELFAFNLNGSGLHAPSLGIIVTHTTRNFCISDKQIPRLIRR